MFRRLRGLVDGVRGRNERSPDHHVQVLHDSFGWAAFPTVVENVWKAFRCFNVHGFNMKYNEDGQYTSALEIGSSGEACLLAVQPNNLDVDVLPGSMPMPLPFGGLGGPRSKTVQGGALDTPMNNESRGICYQEMVDDSS